MYFFALITLSALAVYISISGQGTAILNKDTTFSSRNLIWAFVLSKIYENPFGHGISQFNSYFGGNETSFLHNVGFTVAHAHNGFIEVLYALGLVGVLASVKLLYGSVRESLEKSNFKLNLTIITSIIVINTFESRFISFDFGFLVLCIIICLNKKFIALKNPQPLACRAN
ncbi:hypothetical protein D9M68_630570 [compost metagenome]